MLNPYSYLLGLILELNELMLIVRIKLNLLFK